MVRKLVRDRAARALPANIARYRSLLRTSALQQFVWYKRSCRSARKNGATGSVCFAPGVPDPQYVLWKVVHRLGLKIVRVSRADTWCSVFWLDETRVARDRARSDAINGRCLDISKSRVDAAMERTFSYSLALDPERHTGQAVRKSDANGLHDGEIVSCPTNREDGQVYQRIVDNVVDDMVEDLRAVVICGAIVLVYRKLRPVTRRFDNLNSIVSVCEPGEVFSSQEIHDLRAFCDDVGLDLGEIDVLRDRSTGRVYVVDVNNTCHGPPNHLPARDGRAAVDRMANAFAMQFRADWRRFCGQPRVCKSTGATRRGRAVTSLAIAAVTYNSLRDVSHFLPGYLVAASELGTQVVVVDNGSTDGTREYLAGVRSAHSNLATLLARNNEGYAAAVNQAFAALDAEWLMLLNPDVAVDDLSTISALAGFADSHPRAAVVAPRLMNADGSVQTSARRFPSVLAMAGRATALRRLPAASKAATRYCAPASRAHPTETDWVIGAAMLIRRTAFESVGGWDEHFFLYLEDVDFCFRLKQQGWETWYVPNLTMRHVHRRASDRSKGGVIASRARRSHIKSAVRFFLKHPTLML